MPNISVIIVGHNSRHFLKGCLDSVYNQVYSDIEIIFVDNNSSDDTADFIRENYPEVKLIKNGLNLGFSKANNQAINLSKGRYVLTLNPDVVLEKDFLSNLVGAFETCALEDNIGMLGGRLLRKDKKTLDSAGLALTKFRRFYDRGSGMPNNGNFEKLVKIFGPCAAAALYRRDMLEDIKNNEEYFDNDFFAFAEDVDLSWRANKKGWRAFYVPSAVCYHERHSLKLDKSLVQYYSFRNRYLMMFKNDKFHPRHILIIFLYDLPRFFYLLLTNRKTLKALAEIIRLYRPMLAKRKECA